MIVIIINNIIKINNISLFHQPTCWSTKNINIILLSDGGLKDQGQFFDARPNFPTGVVIVIVFSFFVLFLMTTVNVNVIGVVISFVIVVKK